LKIGLLYRLAAVLASAFGLVVRANAHGFEERYDLPLPPGYFVAGACAAVFLTFVIAIVFVRRKTGTQQAPAGRSELRLSWPAFGWFIYVARSVTWLLFILTVVAALWGSADPLMNLAPTFIWVVWWVGMSFAVMLLGNFWTALDPWRSSFEALQFLFRRFRISRGIEQGWKWPARVGIWPAAVLLLAWCWLEVVYPIASSPFKLGCGAVLWSVISLTGMFCFGRANWQRHADVFAIYFATLGRLAPVKFRSRPPGIFCRRPGEGLVTPSQSAPRGEIGFVMAMLSTVIFDGLHGGAAWTVFEKGLRRLIPGAIDGNGYFAGTVGLLAVWLVFMLAYLITCWSCATISASFGHASADIKGEFLPALVPIAGAYNIAHNFSNLLIQGQTIFQLLSDPLGRQWNLFGTARFYPDISIVDARLTWYVAVVSIVAGHVMSIWLSHRIALGLRYSPMQTAFLTVPLTALMLGYTATSLIIIAEPMVSFSP
jgi:hypothetical protein